MTHVFHFTGCFMTAAASGNAKLKVAQAIVQYANCSLAGILAPGEDYGIRGRIRTSWVAFQHFWYHSAIPARICAGAQTPHCVRAGGNPGISAGHHKFDRNASRRVCHAAEIGKPPLRNGSAQLMRSHRCAPYLRRIRMRQGSRRRSMVRLRTLI